MHVSKRVLLGVYIVVPIVEKFYISGKRVTFLFSDRQFLTFIFLFAGRNIFNTSYFCSECSKNTGYTYYYLNIKAC